MNEFYVYIFLDQTKKGKFIYENFSFNFEPFYVGVSKLKNRINDHLREAKTNIGNNKYKINKIKKINSKVNNPPKILFFKKNLSKSEAFEIEKLLIKTIGRRNLGTGPLTNLTDGGEGTYGYIPSSIAKENWRRSITKYYKNDENRKKAGYYNTLEYFIETFGKEMGEKKYNERIEKMKKSIRNTYKNPEIREKCALRGEANPMYGLPCPSAIKVEVNNVLYNSIYEASKKTGVPYTTISQRLRSDNFKEYKILSKKNGDGE
jgi:hypothetical protein